MILFGEFAPDVADQNINVATVADNCIAGANSYQPLDSLSTSVHSISSTATQVVTGLYINDLKIGEYVIMNHGTKIFADTNDISPATPVIVGYIVNGYPFLLWKDNLIIGGGGMKPQIISSAGLGTGGTTKVTTIDATLPNSYTCGKVRDFVVIGGLVDTTTSPFIFADQVRWSGFDDHTEWTVGTNQSGFQDLKGGLVTRIIGGEYGIIFQEDKITRMTYIGTPLIFQFDEIESAKGCIAGQSVVQVGSDIYYLSVDGFYVLKDGVTSVPIGANKVDKWFYKNLSNDIPVSDPATPKFRETSEQIIGAHDEIHDVIIWSFPSINHTLNEPNDRAIIYNIKSQKWSTATINTSSLFSTGVKLSAAGEDYIQPFSLGAYVADTVTSELKYFTGTPLAATVETGEISTDGKLTQLTEVRPVIDGTCTVTVATRDLLSDTPTETSALTVDSTGKANPRTHARYHKIKCTTSGAFTNAIGVEVSPKDRGKR